MAIDCQWHKRLVFTIFQKQRYFAFFVDPVFRCKRSTALSVGILQPTDETQQPIEYRERMGRAARNIKIHWDLGVGTVVHFFVAGIGSTGDSAGAHSYDQLGSGNRLISF